MKIQSTLIMLGAFLVAVATLATVRLLKTPSVTERAARQAKVLPALQEQKVEDVTRVVLRRKGETLEFERKGPEQWQMTSPVRAAADPAQMRSIITSLSNLERLNRAAVIAATPQRLKEFGLEPPSESIRIDSASEGGKPQSVTLDVGAQVAGGQGYYVRPEGASTIFAVDAETLSAVQKKPVEYRQTRLLTASPYDATALTLHGKSFVVSAEKDNEKWRLNEPIRAAADATKIDDLIRKATDIKVDPPAGFVDDRPKELSKYGLSDPQLTVEIKDPRQNLDQKLQIGSKLPGAADKVYAKLADQDNVVAIPAAVLVDLSKPAAELRSRELVDLDPLRVDVVEVRIRAPEARYTLAKTNNTWKVYGPKPAPAEGAAVEALLNKVLKMRVEEFLDAAKPAAYGLDKPAASLAFWKDGLKGADTDSSQDKAAAASESSAPPKPQGKPLTIRFGTHDAAKKRVYAQVEGSGGVVALPDEVWSSVQEPALAYRARDVMSFSRNDVSELSIARDGKTFVVRPATDAAAGSWRLLQPVAAAADLSAVNNVLNHLDHLRAEKFLTEDPADWKPYGLDKPQIRVSVTLKAEKDKKPEQVGIDVGNRLADGPDFFARRRDGNLVFAITPVLQHDLSAELRDRRVFAFDTAKIEALALSYASAGQVELRHNAAAKEPAGQWTEVKGPKLALDPKRVQAFAEALAHFQADRFVYDSPAKPDVFGLSKPSLTVEAKVQGEKPKVLKIGGSNGHDARYASAEGADVPVFLVSEASVRDVLKGPAYFAQEGTAPPQPIPASPPGHGPVGAPQTHRREEMGQRRH